MKGKPPEKAVAPDKGKQADKAKDAAKPRRGRPARADKAAPRQGQAATSGQKCPKANRLPGKALPLRAEAPAANRAAARPSGCHPWRERRNRVSQSCRVASVQKITPLVSGTMRKCRGLVESVKAAGVNQPALVRPREGGGYEIIAGHRRQRASELAGFVNMPCIVRNMTDDEAILAMTDDNLRHRERILPTEKAAALKQQVEAIKHQGAPARRG